MSDFRFARLLAAALLVAGGMAFAPEAFAEDAPPPGADLYLITFPSTRMLKKRAIEVRFTHRFAPNIDESDWHNLWGFDGPSRIGLGVERAFHERFQAGVYRYSLLENWEFSGRWFAGRLGGLTEKGLLASEHALRFGTNQLTDVLLPPENDSFAFVQWTAAFHAGRGAYAYLVPTYVVNTSDSARDVVALPAAVAYPLTKKLLLVGEFHPRNRDIEGTKHGWAVSLDYRVGAHHFAIVVSSTSATSVNDYASAIYNADSRDMRFGFNLSRRFDRVKSR